MGLDDYDMEQFDSWCGDITGSLEVEENGHVHTCHIGDGSMVRVESHGSFKVDDQQGDMETKIDTDYHNVPLAESVQRRGKLLSIGTGGRDGTVVNVSPPRS